MGGQAAYIGLGSNLGDRIKALETAVENLQRMEGIRNLALSGLYETSAVGIKSGSFVNAVAMIQSELEPLRLLQELLDVETTMGRRREKGKTISRLIDLDLLLYGECEMNEENLILPHPRMLVRRFVLEPLAELEPLLKLPPSGITVTEAAANLAKSHPEQKVKRLGTMKDVKERLRFKV